MIKPEVLMEMYKEFVESRPPLAENEAYLFGFRKAEEVYLARIARAEADLKTALGHLSGN